MSDLMEKIMYASAGAVVVALFNAAMSGDDKKEQPKTNKTEPKAEVKKKEETAVNPEVVKPDGFEKARKDLGIITVPAWDFCNSLIAYYSKKNVAPSNMVEDFPDVFKSFKLNKEYAIYISGRIARDLEYFEKAGTRVSPKMFYKRANKPPKNDIENELVAYIEFKIYFPNLKWRQNTMNQNTTIPNTKPMIQSTVVDPIISEVFDVRSMPQNMDATTKNMLLQLVYRLGSKLRSNDNSAQLGVVRASVVNSKFRFNKLLLKNNSFGFRMKNNTMSIEMYINGQVSFMELRNQQAAQ